MDSRVELPSAATTIGAPAAVLNAVNDALADTGARFDHIPVLPQDLSAALGGSS